MTANRAEALLEPTLKALSTAYERLLQLQPLTDACTDCPIAAFDIAPSVALVDISLAPLAITLLPQLNIAANIHVKLVCWAPLSAKGGERQHVPDASVWAYSRDGGDGEEQGDLFQIISPVGRARPPLAGASRARPHHELPLHSQTSHSSVSL